MRACGNDGKNNTNRPVECPSSSHIHNIIHRERGREGAPRLDFDRSVLGCYDVYISIYRPRGRGGSEPLRLVIICIAATAHNILLYSRTIEVLEELHWRCYIICKTCRREKNEWPATENTSTTSLQRIYIYIYICTCATVQGHCQDDLLGSSSPVKYVIYMRRVPPQIVIAVAVVSRPVRLARFFFLSSF